MKRNIVVIVALGLMLPQLAFAVWWNPFTWKIFTRWSEPRVEQTATPEPTVSKSPGTVRPPAPTPSKPKATARPATPAPAPTEDSVLKVARCQALAQQKVDTAVALAISRIDAMFKPQIDIAYNKWVEARREQIRRQMETPPDMIGASPAQQDSVRDSAAQAVQPVIDYYASLVRQLEGKLESAKAEAREIGRQSYQTYYLECLNS